MSGWRAQKTRHMAGSSVCLVAGGRNGLIRFAARLILALLASQHVASPAPAATSKILLPRLRKMSPILNRICQNMSSPTTVEPPKTDRMATRER